MRAADLPQFYNAADLVERNLIHHADKVALYSCDRCLTFHAVADEANQLGNALLQLGVRFGDCVGILAPDSAEWVTTFFGTIKSVSRRGRRCRKQSGNSGNNRRGWPFSTRLAALRPFIPFLLTALAICDR